MEHVGIPPAVAQTWFNVTISPNHAFVQLTEEWARSASDLLGAAIRRCYVSDELIQERSEALRVSRREIAASRLPDAGSVMSGDFGEILTFIFQAAFEHPVVINGPKKWRLKQDRRKPAPYSDVMHFKLHSWPNADARDEILCAEVKTKATDGASLPIPEAIADCAKDRTSRMAATLLWLRDRALSENIDGVSLSQLQRFINATEYPAYIKRFRAVAVICSSLVEGEMSEIPAEGSQEYELVIMSIPRLHATYSAAFSSALNV